MICPSELPVTCITGHPAFFDLGWFYRQQPSPITGIKPKEHKMTFLSLTKTAAKTSILTIALMAAMPSTSFASAANANIKISKADLKSKCDSSGGKFNSDSDGYTCEVDRNDGSWSIVSCSNPQSCFGQNIDAPVIRDQGIRKGQRTNVRGALAVSK